MKTTSLAVALILLTSVTPAQESYAPGTAGAGGLTPTLSCGTAYMGNAAFSLDVENAYGGGLAWFGASITQGASTFAGVSVWVDLTPTNNFLLTSLPLSGPAGVAGSGQASLSYPLNIPVTPALAGLTVYAQAVIDEGGVYAATNALEIELVMPPRIIVGTSVGGSTDPVYVIDPTVPALDVSYNAGVGSLPGVINNTTDAEYAHGGRRAYFGQSIGNAIQELNFDVNPPTWSTFYSAQGSTYGIGVDHDNDRLYTLDGSTVLGRELTAIDCDLNSPNYGTVIGATVGLGAVSGYIERWELSPDGRRAAVLTVFSGQLILVDTDPSSSNYLGWSLVGPVPAGPAIFPLVTGVDFSPDGLQLIATIQTGGGAPGEIARYDVLLGQWLDHNAQLPGIQNIGPQSDPVAPTPAAPWEPEFSFDGTFAAVSFTSGGIARVDLDPNNPFVWSFNLLASPVALNGGSWANAVSPDGTQIATYGSGSLVILNANGTFFGSVPLPGAGNVYTITWQHQ